MDVCLIYGISVRAVGNAWYDTRMNDLHSAFIELSYTTPHSP